jgi:hypothetical protein
LLSRHHRPMTTRSGVRSACESASVVRGMPREYGEIRNREARREIKDSKHVVKCQGQGRAGKWLFCSACRLFCYLSCQLWSRSANLYWAEHFGK